MKNLSLLLLIVMFAACKQSGKPANIKATDSVSIINAGKLWASLYQQRAAEYKALCFQAYNIAAERIDRAVQQRGKKPLAVVTDIDETVLDNSPYDAERALHNLNYDSKTWKEWTAKAVCDTVPGAASFLRYAASKGVKVFYITNRDENERTGTLKNLQRYHLPDAVNDHLFLKQDSSSKQGRRLQVMQKYHVVLLCGDNLPDFDALYDNKPSEESRNANTEKWRKQFGNRYIVIPNLSYGDFEGALFKFNYQLSPTQKDSIIRAVIKTSSDLH